MAIETKTAPLDADRVGLATFALMAADREERSSGSTPRSVEEVLDAINFTPAEIHALTGANYNTIRTRLRRAKKS